MTEDSNGATPSNYGWARDGDGDAYRQLDDPQTLDEVETFFAACDDDSDIEIERVWGDDDSRVETPEFVGVNRHYGYGEKSVWVEGVAYSIPLAPDSIIRIREIPAESNASLLDEPGMVEHARPSRANYHNTRSLV